MWHTAAAVAVLGGHDIHVRMLIVTAKSSHSHTTHSILLVIVSASTHTCEMEHYLLECLPFVLNAAFELGYAI